MKKYELIPEGKLFRIRALKDFGFIKKGQNINLKRQPSAIYQKQNLGGINYEKV